MAPVYDVLIFDEHPIVAQELAHVLGERLGWNVCATASTLDEAVSAAADYEPDIVLMDPLARTSEDMDAIEVFASRFGSAVAVFSMFDDEVSRGAAAMRGASAFVSKACDTCHLIDELIAMTRRLL